MRGLLFVAIIFLAGCADSRSAPYGAINERPNILLIVVMESPTNLLRKLLPRTKMLLGAAFRLAEN